MSLAPEFAPEVFIPERARRVAPPARRAVRLVQGRAVARDARALLVAAPRGSAPRALVAPGVRPHRIVVPRRHGAPVVSPMLIPSTGWSEPRRVAVTRPPVTLLLGRAPVPSAMLAQSAPPLRVTGRGTVVRAAAMVLLALGLVLTAWLSAPSSSSAAGDVPPMPAMVTVQAGDTLWSLATRLAPDTDPREVVSDLRRVNSLDSVTLQPGQVLRTR